MCVFKYSTVMLLVLVGKSGTFGENKLTNQKTKSELLRQSVSTVSLSCWRRQEGEGRGREAQAVWFSRRHGYIFLSIVFLKCSLATENQFHVKRKIRDRVDT